MRFDDAFPQLMRPLLETVYPNYAGRTPAIAVARVCRGSVARRANTLFLRS
ncbi:type VI secretion system baseplate subunit TssF, partial [Paraburkholderia sediminicola]